MCIFVCDPWLELFSVFIYNCHNQSFIQVETGELENLANYLETAANVQQHLFALWPYYHNHLSLQCKTQRTIP